MSDLDADARGSSSSKKGRRESVFTESDGLLWDLDQLELFDRECVDKAKLESGVLSSLEAIKLSHINESLKRAGSDVEWIMALRSHGYALVEYLLFCLHPSVHNNHRNAAAEALAFAGNIYPKLFKDFVSSRDDAVETLLFTANMALLQIDKLVSTPKEDHSLVVANEVYAGFDERDIDTYNLEGDEYSEYVEARRSRKSTHGIQGLEEVSDAEALVFVWSLLLFHLFANDIMVLKDYILMERMLDDATPAESSDESDGHEAMIRRLRPIKLLTHTTKQLLLQTRRVSEKGSEQFIKSIAAINGQFPERAGGVCSEVAEIFNAAAYEDSIDSMHIMESLLHIVNEVGYPNHVSAEAVPVLKFCIDLVKIDGANGWFYSNDIKVLVDVSLRELSNIAEDDGNVAQDVPLVRVLYIQLIKALLINSPYAGTLGQYRAADVREHFNMIIDGDFSDEWSKEIASSALDELSELLQ